MKDKKTKDDEKKNKKGKKLSSEISVEERQLLRKNKRKRRRRARILFLLTIIILISSGYGIYYIIDTGKLDIKEIRVIGNVKHTYDKIINIADIPLEDNIFSMSTFRARGNLLEDSYIEEAKIKRDLPDKIVIEVKERTAKVAVSYSGYYILLDEHGIVLETVKNEPDLDIVEGFVPESDELGQAIRMKEQGDFYAVLEIANENSVDFQRYTYANGIVKALIYERLYCKSTPENLKNSMGDLIPILDDLESKGIIRGVINIGENDYFSFSPQID